MQNPFLNIVSHVSSLFWPATEKPYYPFLSKLSETGRPLNALVATVVGLAIGSSVNYAQGMLLSIDHAVLDSLSMPSCCSRG